MDIASRLARNLTELRKSRGLSQQQMAQLSGLPRATWANLESGSANPTLQVIAKVAGALQVSFEELVSAPKATGRRYARAELKTRTRGGVTLRSLLPDPIPGMTLERLELPARSGMTGVPHTAGTREYLTCESGRLVLTASGERFELEPGDVVVFRGDQRHAYANPGPSVAVGYSVVVLAPAP
ncbi:MAG: helix-turn-helix transcriptional regulator [Archangiaceae bacterium]|nr:helix-turn-helix transcriptional regulator [Archangiaceae bacterium]